MENIIGRGRSLNLKAGKVTKSNPGANLMKPCQFVTKLKKECTEANIGDNIEKLAVECKSGIENVVISAESPCKKSEGTVIVSHADKVSRNRSTEDKTRCAEKEWHNYKCERQVSKILQNVNEANLMKVLEDLRHLTEEAPLSSRFSSSSEVKQILTVLVNNAVQKDDFLQFAPFLIKSVAEDNSIEFNNYFEEILMMAKDENITVNTSDDLSLNGKRFCKLLGQMLTLPRQVDTMFYKRVHSFVGKCVKSWTYPGNAEFDFQGFRESLVIVFAFAVKHLLMETIERMLPCDREVERKMEAFVGLVKETILNVNLSRKVREAFLDVIVEVESCRVCKRAEQRSSKNDKPSNLENEDSGDDVIIEDSDDCDSDKFDENSADLRTTSETVFHDNSLSVNARRCSAATQNSTEAHDDYFYVKSLLKDLRLEGLLCTFKENCIEDAVLTEPNIKYKLQKIGISDVHCHLIAMTLKGYDRLQSSLASFETNETASLHSAGFTDDATKRFLLLDDEEECASGIDDTTQFTNVFTLDDFPEQRNQQANDSRSSFISKPGAFKQQANYKKTRNKPTRNQPRDFSPLSSGSPRSFEYTRGKNNRRGYSNNKRSQNTRSTPSVNSNLHDLAQTPPRKVEFGVEKPIVCLRCQKHGHQSAECPVINPFF